MMLNFVAVFFIGYLVTGGGPLHDPASIGNPVSPQVPSSVRLPILLPMSRLHAGIFIALISVFILYVLMEKTTLGYRIKAVGANARAAHVSGISVTNAIIISMLLSGGFAGVAGMVEVFGVSYRLTPSLSANYGYTAIMVALLANKNPLGVALCAFLFGALVVGADTMARQTGVTIFIAYTIQGVIVAMSMIFEQVKMKDVEGLINRIRIKLKGGE